MNERFKHMLDEAAKLGQERLERGDALEYAERSIGEPLGVDEYELPALETTHLTDN